MLLTDTQIAGLGRATDAWFLHAIGRRLLTHINGQEQYDVMGANRQAVKVWVSQLV
jgi:hypothetical protein